MTSSLTIQPMSSHARLFIIGEVDHIRDQYATGASLLHIAESIRLQWEQHTGEILGLVDVLSVVSELMAPPRRPSTVVPF